MNGLIRKMSVGTAIALLTAYGHGQTASGTTTGAAGEPQVSSNLVGAGVDTWQPGMDGKTVVAAIEGRQDKSLPTEAKAHAPGAASDAEVPVKGIDRRSDAAIEAQAKTLMTQALASPSGSASVTLETYPGHITMLTVRTKSGGAEMHRDMNDMFVVLDGEAAETTGGTIVGAKETTPGETRGTRVDGGTETPMRKGDVIHISPNTPHQTILAPGKTFTYYVIKVAVPKS
jgi:mannose-6-phosphate isomerase-like protein (cupin superfamily)